MLKVKRLRLSRMRCQSCEEFWREVFVLRVVTLFIFRQRALVEKSSTLFFFSQERPEGPLHQRSPFFFSPVWRTAFSDLENQLKQDGPLFFFRWETGPPFFFRQGFREPDWTSDCRASILHTWSTERSLKENTYPSPGAYVRHINFKVREGMCSVLRCVHRLSKSDRP